jgi:hypothetical protein
MTEKEFRDLIGKDVVVDYPFFNELQQWDMRNFYVDENGKIHHKRLPLIIENFIRNARNPHKGKATHG